MFDYVVLMKDNSRYDLNGIATIGTVVNLLLSYSNSIAGVGFEISTDIYR